MLADIVLAVDIGGTKMSAGVVTASGDLLDEVRTLSRPAVDGEALFATLTELIARVQAPEMRACGVGCGGPMSPGGAEVSPLNIGGWRSFPLQARLAETTGLATYVDNDAKALARAEGWVGAAAGVSDFVAMVVSTGVGGGIVVDGRLLDGAAGNAGHIGHVIVEPDGPLCACGARGCLEALASGPAIAAATGVAPEQATLEVIERTGVLVGRAVASTANLLDLDLAVVAGSVALGFGDPFFAAAQAELDASCRLDHSRGVAIRPGGLGAAGPLIGAAAVAWDQLGLELFAPR